MLHIIILEVKLKNINPTDKVASAGCRWNSGVYAQQMLKTNNMAKGSNINSASTLFFAFFQTLWSIFIINTKILYIYIYIIITIITQGLKLL